MATLTYDPTPSDQPEFSEAEQEAIQVGEEAIAEQNKMFAGKFEDAEALEQAYIELQKKLGEPKDEPVEEQGVRNEEEAPEEEVEVNPNQQVLMDASNEYYSNEGKLSEETISKLSEMDSKDLIAAYLETQQAQPQQQSVDLSTEDANAIQKMVGGEEQYSQLMQWAGENLPENVIDGFDSLVDSGNPMAISLAVRGLMAEYESQNGMEGQMLTGKPAVDKQDTFRSQAEVVQAMSDPRYDRDPAYRQDVFAKLERSNLNY
jgi:hypothetical protein